MVEAALRRASPLAGHQRAAVTPLPPTTLLSARGGPEAARRIGRAFGVDLPAEPLRAREADGRAALWLGPDEWLLLARDDDRTLARTLEAALAGEPGCVVDVSHRNTGFAVAGQGAADALNAGCPLDLGLEAFPVGMCTRTVLAKADVVLWRRADDAFRLECWRSFAPYVVDLLRQAAQDCG